MNVEKHGLKHFFRGQKHLFKIAQQNCAKKNPRSENNMYVKARKMDRACQMFKIIS